MKSTPRIFVEVDGMGMEGLSTAVAAVAASPDLVVSLRCGFLCSSNDLEPFGSDMEVVIVPEIGKLRLKNFPHFLVARARQPISGLGFVCTVNIP